MEITHQEEYNANVSQLHHQESLLETGGENQEV
jgi:hypothetical protein